MSDDLIEALRQQVIALSDQANYQSGRLEILCAALSGLFATHPNPRALAGIVRDCAEQQMNGSATPIPARSQGLRDQANDLLDILSEPPLD